MPRFIPLRWLTPIALMGLLAGTSQAQPRAAPAEDGRSAPLSLQSQLGSIPLVSPRAAARAAAFRIARLTQVAGRELVGEPKVINCPDTGCQQVVSLVVDGAAQNFLLDIQFVSKGTYVSLQSRSAAIGSVMEFRQGSPGPVFIRGGDAGVSDQRLSFVTAAAASLRRLDTGPGDGRTLASGNVFTRKRAPDMVVRLEIAQSKERP